MMFTSRELQIIAVLARDAAEDASLVRQSAFEQHHLTDTEIQVYIDELRAIEARAQALSTSTAEYAPDDEPPIEAYDADEIEEPLGPTPEELAEIDAEFDTGQLE